VGTVNGRIFDLSAYAGRSLSGAGFIELMSSNGDDASVDIAEIALVAGSLPPPAVHLYGWGVDSRYTNADCVLDSGVSGISLDLDAVDASSVVTLVNWKLPHIVLSSYAYMDVTVSGSSNALVRMWFYLDDGSFIMFANRENVGTVNGKIFDLGAYAGRSLSGTGFIELRTSDGGDANIDIIGIDLVAGSLPEPTIHLYGWAMDSRYTNAGYTLDSGVSGISLDLDAVDASSVVTLVNWRLPHIALSGYSYMDVAVSGSSNALVRMWFYLDDGSYIMFANRENVGTVNGRIFDLAAYAGRTLSGAGFIELMSSDGADASIDINDIGLVA
jgi:hypothetical protein